MHVLYCVVHVLRQTQAIELLLWERPAVCVLCCFTQIEAIPGSVGLARCMFCVMFCMHWAIHQSNELLLRDRPELSKCKCCIVLYTNWGNVSLTLCFCGIAQMHVSHWVLHAGRQCQANELLLCDRPDECVLLCFTRIEAKLGQRIASVRLRRCVPCIMFYTDWGHIGIAPQMHVLYCFV